MSNQQAFQTFHDAPSEVTLAPSEATLCPSETGLLPPSTQQQHQQQRQQRRKSKIIRAKAKSVLKGIADSYIADTRASTFAAGQPVSLPFNISLFSLPRKTSTSP
jgi:hypothetical protein